VVAAPAPVSVSRPARAVVEDQAERQNGLRKIALYAGLGFLFLRLSDVSNLLLFYTHVNFYLLYLFAPFAILGVLTTGGIQRTFRHNAAKYWVAFFLWMLLATPFSFWKSSSLGLVMNYGRVQLPMLFLLGGLAMSWKEIRLILYTVAAAAVANLATARLFAKLDNGGRIKLDVSSSIGNSNDLGALMLLVLPFLLFVILDRARNAILRVSLLPLLAYGAWIVLGTGSRGCMIAIVTMFLFGIWRASPRQRAGILVVGFALAVAIPLLLPGSVLTRLSSLFEEDRHLEAKQSAALRQYLLKQSLIYTFQHPIFGVGPGQFTDYEGSEKLAQGKHGEWSVTHNFMTQVSSECGIPALIFMLMGLGSAFLLVNRTYRQAQRKGFTDIANACFCYQLSMIGFLVSIIFLAQAYSFYLPTMVGLAISMSLIAMRHMSIQQKPSVPAAPSPAFAVR
jgi:O-antigen ligase